MQQYKADLHTHTVLSPCGDLAMSPKNIVEAALSKKVNIMAITDHNSTLMCKIIHDYALNYGITIIPGVEINTKEEAHCLAYFHNFEQVAEFQIYLEKHLPFVQNNVDYFGYQVVVNVEEEIVDEIESLLITALDVSIEEASKKVYEIGGVFIPAHIDRPKNSIISQLGFIPPDLKVDAIELSKHTTLEIFLKQNSMYKRHSFTQSSDAHFIENIGDAFTLFELESPTLTEIFMAIHQVEGRRIVSQNTLKSSARR